MPITTPLLQPKTKSGTRQTLIEAGVQALHSAGYTASGVQEIVAAANVPKGSFYNHFSSKEAFGAEVIEALSKRILAKLELALTDETTPPRQRLLEDFRARGQVHAKSGFVRGCMFGNLSLEVADHSTVMRDCLKAHFQQWRDLIEACIAAAQKDGSIRNPAPARKLADFTLNAWEGAVLRSRSEKTSEAIVVFLEMIFDDVLI